MDLDKTDVPVLHTGQRNETKQNKTESDFNPHAKC